MSMRREDFTALVDAVRHCADYAVEAQRNITRDYKDDGTVLTATDLYISDYLLAVIREHFPDCSVISEEEKTERHLQAPYTFVIDPIDGTDVYSQGFPSWCIAVGIMDAGFSPVGSIISAPRWGVGTIDGLLLTLFPGDELPQLNGEVFSIEGKDFSSVSQLIVCSGSYKTIDFSRIYGKLRSFGSNILHILAPGIYNHIQGAVFAGCYIWDIAAAHAIVQSLGLEIRYLSGEPFSYTEALLSRDIFSGYALVSDPAGLDILQDAVRLR